MDDKNCSLIGHFQHVKELLHLGYQFKNVIADAHLINPVEIGVLAFVLPGETQIWLPPPLNPFTPSEDIWGAASPDQTFMPPLGTSYSTNAPSPFHSPFTAASDRHCASDIVLGSVVVQ